jgi:hypothetical protein
VQSPSLYIGGGGGITYLVLVTMPTFNLLLHSQTPILSSGPACDCGTVPVNQHSLH